MSKILLFSDPHCGHLVGLTPPEWQIPVSETSRSQRAKYARTQKEIWGWYVKTLKEIGKVDHAFVMGDLVDGDGKKSGGTELITTDRSEQCDMAVECLTLIKTDHMRMVFGTGYHAGNFEDWEAEIAKEMHCKIGSHEFPLVDGVRFDLKHHVASSKHKHLRFTAIATEIKQNNDWANCGCQYRADVTVRGHVHYFDMIKDENSLGVVCPAMQGYGSKFGARRCSGRVNVGLVVLDITNKKVTVQEYLADKVLDCLRAT